MMLIQLFDPEAGRRLRRKLYLRRWYQAHKDGEREKAAVYREANREKIRTWQREWYEKNKERADKKRREWLANNRERRNATSRAWKAQQGEDYHRKFGLRRRYGMTLPEWKALFAAQGNACGCCRSTESGPRGWHVDHDHRAGTVRGILCGNCNRGLGQFKDSIERLRAAIRYLERFETKDSPGSTVPLDPVG